MNFFAVPLQGACVIEIEPIADERGFFARTWCAEEFKSHGLNPNLAQCSISFNQQKGTVRGMHYQERPFEEAKLIRCPSGAIYDVLVDLRRASPTYCKWFATELTAANRKMLYVPEGFAHGFQTLTDGAEVFYQISETYRPAHSRGVRWNDPLFGIEWPIRDLIISERDRTFPDHTP
ncbi:MAG TPA: dTDP-4-dehydrorhamnose 3,5-epimerase [Candidatus Acidoferrales bacterium]|jgi:dTDP-4-dehydrorhamnose 3,5-epimerase|nr:dTDP-4-dehydrorhamnose 3,5-epimerase [Candidatus Acidoferrales bacterium]